MGKYNIKFEPGKAYSMKSLGSVSAKNISHSIGERIMDIASHRSFELAKVTAADAASKISSRPSKLGFHNVTGNLANSIGITILKFKKGRSDGGEVMTFAPFSKRPPTRTSLKKGEFYNLDKYWLGDKVEGKPFRGAVGRGGSYGDVLRKRYADNLSEGVYTKSYNFFQLFAFMAMPYSEFVYAKKGLELMNEIYDICRHSFNNAKLIFNLNDKD